MMLARVSQTFKKSIPKKQLHVEWVEGIAEQPGHVAVRSLSPTAIARRLSRASSLPTPLKDKKFFCSTTTTLGRKKDEDSGVDVKHEQNHYGHSCEAVRSASPRVLCIQPRDPSCIGEMLQRGFRVDELQEEMSPQSLGEIVHDYDAILVAKHVVLDWNVFEHTTRLRMVGIPDTGTGNVDVASATKHGVLVLNLEERHGLSSSSEAELVIAFILSLARGISFADDQSKRSEKVDRKAFTGVELKGKSLGIVGLNRAGASVAEFAASLGMKVFCYDPNLLEEAAEEMGIHRATLDELYHTADFLTFHAPLTEKTKNMFNREAMSKCRKGVRIVNVASAGVIDEMAVMDGLKTGQIGGLALDVFERDPMSDEMKALREDPRVLCTPHLGDSVEEAITRMYKDIAIRLCDAMAGRRYDGVTNAVFMPLTLVPEMKPFVQLSERMGRLLIQIIPGDIIRITIATEGGKEMDITQPKAKSLIQAALLQGMLEQMTSIRTWGEIRPSLVNASILAMAEGISAHIGEPMGEYAPLHNLVTVKVETAKGVAHVLSGSVFGEDPRIVHIDNYRDIPPFRPEGTLLFFNNKDRPGAIAGILKVLAEANINVASLGLAREPSESSPFNLEESNVVNGMALGILTLDGNVSDATMEELASLPGIENVRIAHMK